MFTSHTQTQSSNTSFKDAAFHARALDFNHIIADLTEKLPARQILVSPTTCISKKGEELVHVRTGNPQTATFVRDTMLRLELINVTNPQAFDALRRYFAHNAPMDEASAISNASCGLGDVVESLQVTKEERQRNIQAFFDGMGSILTFGMFSRPLAARPETPRVEFVEKPGVRDIFLSAIRGGNTLGSPEIIC
jgi:hypothetical protein